jgi:sugar lactone lactonase YvrE
MAERRATEFTIAATKIVARLALLAALSVGVWLVVQSPYFPSVSAALHGHDDPDDRYIERVGSAAVVYDARAYRVLECDSGKCDQLDDNGLDYNVRIEVLDSGLIDGRGLAYDPDNMRLIVADAWEGLYGYWPDSPKQNPDRLPWIRVCPGGRCQDVDHRGLAYDPDARRIVVTDYHQHRLALRLQSGEFDRSIGGNRLIDGVTDVALAERGAFFVSATGDSVAANAQSRAGSVYHVTESDAQPIVTGLQRPIGLAFSPCQQRLYIADSSGDGLRLYFFTQDSRSQWQRAGVLSTLPVEGDAPPAPLSGMAVTACRAAPPGAGAISAGGELFVAGPGGLYLFHPDGTLLAKFFLGERVTGLAWDEWKAKRSDVPGQEIHQLYMTVGHRIARLHTTVGPEALSTRRPRPTPPVPGATTTVDQRAPSAPVNGRGGSEAAPPAPEANRR